jgi:hypothetical protein
MRFARHNGHRGLVRKACVMAPALNSCPHLLTFLTMSPWENLSRVMGHIGNRSASAVTSHSRELHAASICASVRPVDGDSSRSPNICISSPRSPPARDAGMSILIPCISICGTTTGGGGTGGGGGTDLDRGLRCRPDDLGSIMSWVIIISMNLRASCAACCESLSNRICKSLNVFSLSTMETYRSVSSLSCIPCLPRRKKAK